MVEWLASIKRDLRGFTLLELGAGCGIAGLAAALLGADRAVITDGAAAATAVAGNNIELNDAAANACARRCVWGGRAPRPPPTPSRRRPTSRHRDAPAAARQRDMGSGYDLIIGADLVFYSTAPATLEALFKTVDLSLWGKFVMTYMIRGPAHLGYPNARLCGAAAAAGFAGKLIEPRGLSQALQSPLCQIVIIDFRRWHGHDSDGPPAAKGPNNDALLSELEALATAYCDRLANPLRQGKRGGDCTDERNGDRKRLKRHDRKLEPDTGEGLFSARRQPAGAVVNSAALASCFSGTPSNNATVGQKSQGIANSFSFGFQYEY